MATQPADIGRNEFDEWCWRRGLTLHQVADGLREIALRLGRDPRAAPSFETVRLIRLPFSDKRRRVPAAEVVELIHAFTGGEILAWHFYPPHLRGEAAAALTPETEGAGR